MFESYQRLQMYIKLSMSPCLEFWWISLGRWDTMAGNSLQAAVVKSCKLELIDIGAKCIRSEVLLHQQVSDMPGGTAEESPAVEN